MKIGKALLVISTIFLTQYGLWSQTAFISTQNHFAINEGLSNLDWSLDLGYSLNYSNMRHGFYLGMDVDSKEIAGLGSSVGYNGVFFGQKGICLDFYLEARSTHLKKRIRPFYTDRQLWMLGFGAGANILFPLVGRQVFLKVGGHYEKMNTTFESRTLKWESIEPGIGLIVWLGGESKENRTIN